MQKTDLQALEDLLLDLDENITEQLASWLPGLNIFEVLKTSTVEIRHSNLLGWLLHPSETHGLGDEFFKRICLKLISDNPAYMEAVGLSVFDISLNNFSDGFVLREHNHIDLFFSSRQNNMNLVFENKIFSHQHSNQLKRYYEKVETDYSGYRNVYVYLTPEGTEAEDDSWVNLGYDAVLEILNNILETKTLAGKTAMLIKDYIGTIRRSIVKDEKLVQICNEIYYKHKQAIDLIVENKPDVRSTAFEYIEKAMKKLAARGKISYDDSKSGKSLIRFRTPTLDSLLPAERTKNGAWSDGSPYYYEINNRANSKLGFSLYFYFGDESRPYHGKMRQILDKAGIHKKEAKWYSVDSWNINLANRIAIENWDLGDVELQLEKFEEVFEKLLEQKVFPLEAKLGKSYKSSSIEMNRNV